MKNKHAKKRKIKNKFKFVTFVLLIILLILIILFFSFIKAKKILNNYLNDLKTNNSQEQDFTNEKNKPTTIKLTAIGDIMCHSTNFADAYNKSSKSYDFSYVFSDIKDIFKNSDYTLGNLETTFAGSNRAYSGYPCFNTPEILAKNLKDIGINLLTTSNNHSLDTGYSGLESTLDFLDNNNISHTGTYKNAEDQNKIFAKNINGINIAFLTYTYGTNGNIIPSGKDYCINLTNKDLILKQIKLAKEQNVDVICTSIHWGNEYQTKQNKEQEELANFLFENGVDIILGGHPHVLEPMEKRKITLPDGSQKDVFIIYSLGNFMSGQTFPNTQDSIILNIEITKNSDNSISLGNITYTPIYMLYSKSSNPKYKILNIEKEIDNYNKNLSNINSKTYETLNKELKQIKSIVGEEILIEKNDL